MPVAGVPDRNRYRLHRDNAKQEVPGKKEFRQDRCILHTTGSRILRNGAAKILLVKHMNDSAGNTESFFEGNS